MVRVRVRRPGRPRSGPTLPREKGNLVTLDVHALNVCSVVTPLQSVADKLSRISSVDQGPGPAARGGRAAAVYGHSALSRSVLSAIHVVSPKLVRALGVAL